MQLAVFKNTFFLLLLLCFSCGSQNKDSNAETSEETLRQAQGDLIIHDTVTISDGMKLEDESQKTHDIVLGANRYSEYLPLLRDKKIGVVANQTSIVNEKTTPTKINGTNSFLNVNTHLVDFFVSESIAVKKVFAPEHGFRGTADAGEVVKDGVDTKTGLPIISLYGKNKKPSSEQLNDIEIMVFDIQDVGARFYTYISTLHYVMEACAEANIPLLVLDRPNPNGHYVDGPILELQHQSFVGMHPVPVVHGMTIGEYAQMINGQGWLKNKLKCDLTVITMENYTHETIYSLPVKPSPNLPNDTAINLYPSLCFFEGTIVSAGRGTDLQFQIFGAPSLPAEYFPFSFTPQSNEGAKYPKFKGETCNGLDLRESKRLSRLNLEWLIEAYVGYGKKANFFNDFFTNLAGTKKLKQQIEMGYTYPEIRATWLRDLEKYEAMRQQYLLYD